MLAAVPKGEMKYFDIDPRSTFFREAEKKDQNYYYRLIPGVKKLQPLGFFRKETIYEDNSGNKTAYYEFEKTGDGYINDALFSDNLYYSKNPLSDSDLDYENNPEIKSIINSYGGRKTKRYRKSKKSRKSRKSKKSKKSRKSRKSKK
jgi:hypothetical protein